MVAGKSLMNCDTLNLDDVVLLARMASIRHSIYHAHIGIEKWHVYLKFWRVHKNCANNTCA